MTLPEQNQLARDIIRSHQLLIPREHQILVGDNIDLDSLPIPVLAHSGTPSNSHDPIMMYGNSIGLKVFKFENDREGFFALPSRCTAKEGSDRESREIAMKNVATMGYTLGYEGIRVAKDGSEFKIVDVMMWNVLNESGDIIGQAALLKKVESSWINL